MNKNLITNFIREVRKTITRFLSIFAICALGVSFFVGLRATSPDMKEAGDTLFHKYSLADITVISSSGLSRDDIKALRGIDGVKYVQPQLFVDAMMQYGEETDTNVKLMSLPLEEKGDYVPLFDLIPSYGIDNDPGYEMNRLNIIEGRLPLDDTEVALDSVLATTVKLSVGDYATFSTGGGKVTLRVVGMVDSPQYIGYFERGTSSIGTGSSDGFGYVSGNALTKLGNKLPIFGLISTMYTRADIIVDGASDYSCYSDEYEACVDRVIERIEAYGATTSGTFYVYGREINPGYSDFSENTDRIAAVGDVFPIIFFVVAALVSLTTMTRMVEEQRIEMGTLKALGYGSISIMMKYFAYAMSACIMGGYLGAVVGFQLFPAVILAAYSIMYHIPEVNTPFRNDIATIAILAAAACTGTATLSAVWTALRDVPSALMRPKAPKAGKRVFIERIPFIWKRLNFTSKVTLRNIFRYKKRFFMSIIGIAGSCSLLVTGFGLKDSIFGIIDLQFGEIWRMDLQGYAYEAMSYDEIDEIVKKSDAADKVDATLYCYDSIVDAGKDGERVGSVHIMGVEDAEKMSKQIRLLENKQEFLLDDTGAVITRKFSEMLSIKAGDTFNVYIGGEPTEIYVTGVADNYASHYIYMTPEYYKSVFLKDMRYNAFMLTLKDAGVVAEPQASGEDAADAKTALADTACEELLMDKRLYTVKTMTSIYEDIEESLSILDYIVLVLIVGSAVLTFVVMLNLTNINLGERKRELATLRVLGFFDKEMYDYIFRENNTLAVLGSLVGLGFGQFMHSFVVKTCEVDLVMFVRTASPLSYVYSCVLTIVFSLVVNLLMRKKVRAIDMVESLKSAE